MKFTKENLKKREKFLTAKLQQELENQPESAVDYFTATENYPKAFRVGSCKIIEPDQKTEMQVVFFWKSEAGSEQKEIYVEVVKENNEWLIDQAATK